jgi:hypothetical protein
MKHTRLRNRQQASHVLLAGTVPKLQADTEAASALAAVTICGMYDTERIQQSLSGDAQREIEIDRACNAMVAARAGGDIPGAYAAQHLMTAIIKGRSSLAAARAPTRSWRAQAPRATVLRVLKAWIMR